MPENDHLFEYTTHTYTVCFQLFWYIQTCHNAPYQKFTLSRQPNSFILLPIANTLNPMQLYLNVLRVNWVIKPHSSLTASNDSNGLNITDFTHHQFKCVWQWNLSFISLKHSNTNSYTTDFYHHHFRCQLHQNTIVFIHNQSLTQTQTSLISIITMIPITKPNKFITSKLYTYTASISNHSSHSRCQIPNRNDLLDSRRNSLHRLRRLQRKLPNMWHLFMHLRWTGAHSQALAMLTHCLQELPGENRRWEWG